MPILAQETHSKSSLDPGGNRHLGERDGMDTPSLPLPQPQTSQSPCRDNCQHAWRRIHAGEPVRAWAYRCDICRRTLAGLVA